MSDGALYLWDTSLAALTPDQITALRARCKPVGQENPTSAESSGALFEAPIWNDPIFFWQFSSFCWSFDGDGFAPDCWSGGIIFDIL
jgi:hypothetical protein